MPVNASKEGKLKKDQIIIVISSWNMASLTSGNILNEMDKYITWVTVDTNNQPLKGFENSYQIIRSYTPPDFPFSCLWKASHNIARFFSNRNTVSSCATNVNRRRSLKFWTMPYRKPYTLKRGKKKTLAIHALFCVSGLNISEVLGKSIETFKVQLVFRDYVWFFCTLFPQKRDWFSPTTWTMDWIVQLTR